MHPHPIAPDAAEDAFATLHRAHALSLTRLAYLLLGDRGLAGDIVRESFADLRRRPGRLADTDGAARYLRARVLRYCRAVLRGSSAARALALVDPGHELPARDLPGHDLPGAGVLCTGTASLGAAERRALLCAVRRLPARQREALVLGFYLGKPEAEVARLMGIRSGSARSVTYRALAALGRLADGDPAGDGAGGGGAATRAGAQFGLESRLQAVLLATAGEVWARDIPRPPAGPLGRGRPARMPAARAAGQAVARAVARAATTVLAVARTIQFRANGLSKSG